MNKNRLEAFSDGVFAIVITLLILEIHLPEVDYSQLGHALIELLPRIFAYVMSFAVIGLYWVGHHQSSLLVKEIDGVFLWLNVLLLLLVSFLPFPTALMGRFPLQPIPILIYGANLLAANIVSIGMIVYVQYHPHLSGHPNMRGFVKKRLPFYILINGGYAAAMAVSGILPSLSVAIYALVIIGIMVYYARFRVPKK